MCVRCGTGRVAWCTSPDGHADQYQERDLVKVREAVQAVVELALARHLELGSIRRWRRALTVQPGYVVTLFDDSDATVSLSEALALTYGLDSARQAAAAD